MANFLIVAFDGLDYEYIEKFGLENIQQEEFGKIDNYTGITTRKTGELYASFITGKTAEEHGLYGKDGRSKWNNEVLNRIESKMDMPTLMVGAISKMPWFSRDEKDKTDLEAEAIFDKVSNSKALFVPSYNPPITGRIQIGWRKALRSPVLEMEDGLEMMERRFVWRKHRLFEEIEEDYDLLMCHFFKPDHWQHFHGDWEAPEDKMKKMYQQMDELAGEILEKAEDGYDYIIFMSDHGLKEKEGGGHNKNAFYSCNRQLFGEETPHITDFHDLLMNNIGEEDEVEGLDI